nr:MAG TPA: hypothetical protein [Caudoviricetes sp.]
MSYYQCNFFHLHLLNIKITKFISKTQNLNILNTKI